MPQGPQCLPPPPLTPASSDGRGGLLPSEPKAAPPWGRGAPSMADERGAEPVQHHLQSLMCLVKVRGTAGAGQERTWPTAG